MKGLLMGKQKEQTVQTAPQAPQPARIGALAEARAALQANQVKLENIQAQIREARQMSDQEGVTAEGVMLAQAAHAVLGHLTVAENHAKGLCRISEDNLAQRELNHKHAKAEYDETAKLLNVWTPSSAEVLMQMRDTLGELSKEIYSVDRLAALTLDEALLKLTAVCARWSALQQRFADAQRNLERLGD